MRKILFCLAVGALWGGPASGLSDREIRREVARISKVAAKEPPMMAVDTLLQVAALVQPYLPKEAERLHRQVVRLVERHPDVRVSSTMVKLWMRLDPRGAEARILRLKQRRRALEALIVYHQREGNRERSVELASEAIRTAPEEASSERDNLRIIAEARPLEAVELFDLLRRDPKAQPRLPDSTLGLLEGLGRALDTQPESASAALERLVPALEDPEFGSHARHEVTTRFRIGEQVVETKDSRATLLLTAALLERQLRPGAAISPAYEAWAAELGQLKSQEAARQALRMRINSFALRGASQGERSRSTAVPPDLPVAEALAEIRKKDGARAQLLELWRFLTIKPRPEAEIGHLVSTLLEWAERAPAEADPYWPVESLLNLDGRLRPGRKPWSLPAQLRTLVFHAAARVGQRMDRDPDQSANLVQAMRREKIPLPAGVPSAEARARTADLRAALEERFDFTLAAIEGPPRRLKAERGKVVVLIFWATWCGPCREQMLALRQLYDHLRDRGLDVFAITDENAATVRDFLAKNPAGVPVLLDENGRVFEHYGVQGRPQTIVLDRAGRRAGRFNGPQAEALRTAVESALQLGH